MYRLCTNYVPIYKLCTNYAVTLHKLYTNIAKTKHKQVQTTKLSSQTCHPNKETEDRYNLDYLVCLYLLQFPVKFVLCLCSLSPRNNVELSIIKTTVDWKGLSKVRIKVQIQQHLIGVCLIYKETELHYSKHEEKR